MNLNIKSLLRHAPLFSLLLLGFVSCSTPPQTSHQKDATYLTLEGEGIGTYYQITLRDSLERNLQPAIDSILREMNRVFSIFSENSVINRFNQSDWGVVDHELAQLTTKAIEYANLSQQAFEPTIAPLVRLWGFGTEKPQIPTETEIKTVLEKIGMHHISVRGDSVLKDRPDIELVYNAIAKGYTVDKVADLLHQKGIRHYLVNIGGEIRAEGLSSRAKPWILGIETPQQDLTPGSSIVQRLYLPKLALATSGNYRSHREVGNEHWGHTINPKTGYPEANKLLSATVLAPTCAEADALATAFMVLGLEAAVELLERLQGVEAVLITQEDSVSYGLWRSEGMSNYLLDD